MVDFFHFKKKVMIEQIQLQKNPGKSGSKESTSFFKGTFEMILISTCIYEISKEILCLIFQVT